VKFNYRYAGQTAVDSGATRGAMNFVPDTLREPTFFTGKLHKHVAFREAISALHDVVVSDLRWKPKDKSEYKAWAEANEQIDWQKVAQQRGAVKADMDALTAEIKSLRENRWDRWRPFYNKQQAYFNYLYKRDMDAWYVLDPVITVHPDEVFFECFSIDESTYGRLGASYEVFKDIGEFSCGTTNIDYSSALYDEFQKIRSYKETDFSIDASGFDVETTGEDKYNEVKIDLPDSWVRGFLQVSSAMGLNAVHFDLSPVDIHNLCFVLRRNREIVGPRSMRFILKPGEPIVVRFDPWGKDVVCRRSIYQGDGEHEIRVWGRRRIHILERLLPVSKRFSVHLLGYGMPSFWVADLGDLTFTLGLSGWTANDWSQSGNFDLLAPRAEVDEISMRRVFEALKVDYALSAEALAGKLDMAQKNVLGALSAYTQAGRVMYDLHKGVYRLRELTRDPLPLDVLRFSNKREEDAEKLLEASAVKLKQRDDLQGGGVRLVGTVSDRGKKYNVQARIDGDERLKTATCECNFFQQNKMRKGPCEHVLALRMARGKKLTSRLFGFK